jgi:predicted DNA-binding transcriptional regulator AlpA
VSALGPDESISNLIRKARKRDLGMIFSEEVPEFETPPLNLAEAYADLVGISELVGMLGVKRKKIYKWIELRESTGCPHPVRILTCGYVFSRASWQGWFELWKKTRGAGFYDDFE